MKRLELEYVLSAWGPGSGNWPWAAEFGDLLTRDGGALASLLADVAVHGIREPLLLGDDRRVWDGHHRLLVARLLGLTAIPVQHAADLRVG